MRVLVVGAGAVGSPGGTARNKPHVYATPERLSLNHWALTGNWTVGREAIGLNEPPGELRRRGLLG